MILEGTPIVGHAMSAGYAAGGDPDKAEQVALAATKSTVVAGSALTDDQEPDPLLSSLSTLAFAFDNMVAENLVGSGLQLWLCSLFSMGQQEQCILKLRQGLREVL